MFLDDVGTVDELVVSLGDHWSRSGGVSWEDYARPLERLVPSSNVPIYALSTRFNMPQPLTLLATQDQWKFFNRSAVIEPLVESFNKQSWPMDMLYADSVHFWGWVYDRLNAELLRVLLHPKS